MANDIQAATAKIEKYLAERAKAGQLDPIDIHALHMGDEREAVLTTTDVRLILSANREMREEPRVLAVTLEGMQGEPAGMMTVGVQMTDGQKFDLIRTNGTVISHWARLPDAEARSALTTQRGGE